MTATANPPLDRVTDAVLHARADLASVSDTPMWTLNARATTAAIDELLALEAQVTELKTRLLSHADQIKTDESGATSTANWFTNRESGADGRRMGWGQFIRWADPRSPLRARCPAAPCRARSR